MTQSTFDTPLIKIESLKTKFDTVVVSNSFITLIGDYVEALFLHQLHYWTFSQYGVVIDGTRWIYKPLREWLSELFTFLTDWKLRKAIASLLEKGLISRKKLYVKHHEIKHDNPYWHPKNQTYYYSVNYDRLQELIDEVETLENAESTENVRFENSTKLSIEDFQDTKSCDCPQNRSKNTSIENYSKDESHPTLPSEGEEIKTNSQEKEPDSNLELPTSQAERNKAHEKVIERDITSEDVEENINQYTSTTKRVVQENVQERSTVQENVQEDVQIASATKSIVKPKLKTPKGTKPNRKNKAPWKDEGQFKRFYRALIQALPIVANAHSPQGLAQTIIRQLRSGIPHSYWDDFIAGLPIGSSSKPEWEIEPGVPYPMFIEYLTEKIRKGDNTTTNEQTRNEVFRILDKPRQAKAFWGQFKRSVVNVSEQVERDRALGISNPNTPVWTIERIEPTISEAEEAGKLIMAVNSAVGTAIEAATNPQLESVEPLPNQLSSPPTPDPWMDEGEKTESQPPSGDSDEVSLTMSELLTKKLGVRNLKGFTKQMPKVSQAEVDAESRAKMKPKTNISQMSVAEINNYLQEPILRREITPQLMRSDYKLITDELGQIISVRASRDSSSRDSSDFVKLPPKTEE